jgi:hypothetical protein
MYESHPICLDCNGITLPALNKLQSCVVFYFYMHGLRTKYFEYNIVNLYFLVYVDLYFFV